MQTLPNACPFCGGELIVTGLFCTSCLSTFEGQFQSGPFRGLSREQMAFVEAFVRCEGKFNRLEGELGLSYPTLRARLDEIMRVLGAEPGTEERQASDVDRQQVLDDLEAGRVSPDEAVRLLKGEGS